MSDDTAHQGGRESPSGIAPSCRSDSAFKRSSASRQASRANCISVPCSYPFAPKFKGDRKKLLEEFGRSPFGVPRRAADQPFSPFLSLDEEARQRLWPELIRIIDAAKPRRRRRRRLDSENSVSVLAVVVANALRAYDHPVCKRVHYSRTLATYCRPSLYYPDFLRSRMLIGTVDALAVNEMLTETRGVNVYATLHDAGGPRRCQSTFEATPKFVNWLAERGIGVEHITLLAGAPVVVMRDKTKAELAYDPHKPEIAGMIDTVKAYNRFISGFALSLGEAEARLGEMNLKPDKNGKPRSPINLTDTHLCRIFNDGTFEHGGRFCRGWWINVPSEDRKNITIDKEPTVELDYSACFMRMLYHLKGIDYPGDPFEIPVVKAACVEQGLEWNTVRKSIKHLTNVYVNADPAARIGSFPSVTPSLPKGYRRPNHIYELLREMHKAIADRFQSGCGVELMRRESDVCALILLEGVRAKIPVLPVYDSYIVPRRERAWLMEAMVRSYRQVLGFDPVIG